MKKDKIDHALDAFEKTISKHIAKEKRDEERWEEEQKQRKLLEAEVKKLIAEVVRPVMEKLLARVSQRGFHVTVKKLGYSSTFEEFYGIEGNKDDDSYIYYYIKIDNEENILLLGYGSNVGEIDDYENDFIPSQINETTIENLFIEG